MSSLSFYKYDSIINHYQSKFMDRVRAAVPEDAVWVATEKVHGSNLSLQTDGSTVVVGSRTRHLKPTDSFHGWDKLLDAWRERVLRLWAEIHGEAGVEVVVYGEICGGRFPGHASAKPVQHEILYSPSIEFIVFDIARVVKGAEPELQFLPWTETQRLCEAFAMPHVPVLAEGSLDELLARSPVFTSVVPPVFGHPIIEGNESEGFVIRPSNADIRLDDGDRVVIKCKNPAFREDDGAKAAAAMAAAGGAAAKPKPAAKPKAASKGPPPPKFDSPEQKAAYDAWTARINAPRIASTRSKLTEEEAADVREVARLVLEDARAEEGFAPTAEQAESVKDLVTRFSIFAVREYLADVERAAAEAAVAGGGGGGGGGGGDGGSGGGEA